MPLLLVVDDSAQVGLILRKVGQRAGCTVVCQPDAERAWGWLQTTRPDLLLVDHHLPGANGDELIAWLRAHAELAQLAVGLLGHWSRPTELLRGLTAGADLVCVKDLLSRPDECQQRLEEILAWAAGRTAPGLLRWQSTAVDSRPLAEVLARAVAAQTTGGMAPELAALLWRRTFERGHAVAPDLLPPLAAASAWLDAAGTTLVPTRLAAVRAEAVQLLGTLFAEQLWCLVGTAGSAAFRAALPEEPATQ